MRILYLLINSWDPFWKLLLPFVKHIGAFEWMISPWPNFRFSEKHIIRNKYGSFLKILPRSGADYFRIQCEKCPRTARRSVIGMPNRAPIIRGIWHTRNDMRAYIARENRLWRCALTRTQIYPGSTVKYYAEIWSLINPCIYTLLSQGLAWKKRTLYFSRVCKSFVVK